MVGSTPSKHSLSLPQRQLLQLMQQVNFGRIEELVVRAGEPLLDPPPRVVREIKFGGDNGPRPEMRTENFLLKAQVTELFAQLNELGTGTIGVLIVKHGLPFGMEMEDQAACLK